MRIAFAGLHAILLSSFVQGFFVGTRPLQRRSWLIGVVEELKDPEDAPTTEDVVVPHLDAVRKELASSQAVDSNNSAISRVKWKKKRFHMLQDVRNSIQHGDPSAVSNARSMLQRWWKMYERSGGDPVMQPSVEAYNLLLHALARQGRAREAEDVLRAELMQSSVQPDSMSFANVMNAYARSPRGAKEAERLLFEALKLSEAPGSTVKVTTVMCDIVLNAWARAKTRSGAERAEQILRKLETLGVDNIRPTEHSYATVVDAWAKCGGGADAAERADQILRSLIRGDNKHKADTVVFNACINAWAGSRDPRAGSKAQELLRLMQQLHHDEDIPCKPDIVTFNSVLSAWGHSDHVNAALQAEKILKHLVKAHRADPTAPSPSVESFNNVLNAWSKSSLPIRVDRSLSLLNFMLSPNSGKLTPDVYSFTSTLDVLAKSSEADKAVRSKELLDRLLAYRKENRNLRMSQIPFNAVLNAAAFSKTGTTPEQQRDALKVAVGTFTRMKQEGYPPDEVSYGNLLKTISNLVPNGKTKNEMAMDIFRRCCEDGQVGALVWTEIRRAVPSRTLGAVTNPYLKGRSLGNTSVQDLPKSWRQHTKFNQVKKRQSNKAATSRQPAKTSDPTRPVFVESSYQSGKDL